MKITERIIPKNTGIRLVIREVGENMGTSKRYVDIGQAGFWIRVGATLLDGLIIAFPITLIWQLIVGFNTETLTATPGVPDVLMTVYGLLLPVYWYGFTVGKKMCGIRIVKMDGSTPTVLTMLMRDIVAGIVYALTLGIGLVVSAFMVGLREDKRGLHDLIAGTQVVITKEDVTPVNDHRENEEIQ